MALKQLMKRKQLETLNKQLSELTARDEHFSKRNEDLSKSIEEATTDEEMKIVNDEVEALEAEEKEHEDKKAALTGQIEALEEELKEFDDRSAAASTKTKQNRSEQPLKRSYFGTMSYEDRNFLRRMDYRAQVQESLEVEEVRNYYEAMREYVLKKRAITGAELTIPTIVLDRIQILVGDYGKLYAEVDVVQLNGDARVILDGANPEAIWVEMCDPVQELSTAFEAVEIDGFKVGGYIPVCNAILEDSMINLAMYVERKLAISIAKALDKAIAAGTGAAGHQPMGIIPNLKAENIITLTDNVIGGIFGSLFMSMGLIDTGENDVGEIVVFMKRNTYYSRVAPRLVIVNSNGTYTVPNVVNANFAGLRVEFSQYIPDGQALIGDYKKYLLGERAGVKVESSKEVRFIEDQTVFKGTARYDGKPVNLDDDDKTADWILVTIPEVSAVNP